MLITMSDQDINRFKVIQDVCERRLKRAKAYRHFYYSPVQLSYHDTLSQYLVISYVLICY